MPDIDFVALTLREGSLQLQVTKLNGKLDSPVTVKLEENQQLIFSRPHDCFIQSTIIKSVFGGPSSPSENGLAPHVNEEALKEEAVEFQLNGAGSTHRDILRNSIEARSEKSFISGTHFAIDNTTRNAASAHGTSLQCGTSVAMVSERTSPGDMDSNDISDINHELMLSDCLRGDFQTQMDESPLPSLYYPQDSSHPLSAWTSGNTHPAHTSGVERMLAILNALMIFGQIFPVWVRLKRTSFTTREMAALRNALIDLRNQDSRSTRIFMEEVKAALTIALCGLNDTAVRQMMSVVVHLPGYMRSQKYYSTHTAPARIRPRKRDMVDTSASDELQKSGNEEESLAGMASANNHAVDPYNTCNPDLERLEDESFVFAGTDESNESPATVNAS